jgi:uncharacterized membrane protein
MNELGKGLVFMGGLIVLVGLVLLLAGKFNLPLGRLPGDIAWRSKNGNTSVYFPVVTSLLVSILLSLIFWIIGAIRK